MRIEYHDCVHFACAFPVAQQVLGAATILSSLARLVWHSVQSIFSKSEELSREIQKDKEGLRLGAYRMIPGVGSFLSFLILTKLDRAEGGPIFPALAEEFRLIPST